MNPEDRVTNPTPEEPQDEKWTPEEMLDLARAASGMSNGGTHLRHDAALRMASNRDKGIWPRVRVPEEVDRHDVATLLVNGHYQHADEAMAEWHDRRGSTESGDFDALMEAAGLMAARFALEELYNAGGFPPVMQAIRCAGVKSISASLRGIAEPATQEELAAE